MSRVGAIFVYTLYCGLTLTTYAADPQNSGTPNISDTKDACRVSVSSLIRKLPLNPNALVIGRHPEMNQALHALVRGKSLILLGDSGSGRTSIAEGLAQRIARGDVPESLKGYTILHFDWRMTANTQAFVLEKAQTAEGLLMERLEAAKKDGKKLILHVSELDVLMAPSGDGPMVPEAQRALASRIRLLLAEGEILLIGEAKTTIGIEKDPSFRRFEIINVDPLSTSQVRNVLTQEIRRLRETYKVEIDETAVDAAIELAKRYFPSSPNPQMAKDLLEHAAVIAQQWNQGHPVRIDLLQRQINDVQESLTILKQYPDLYRQSIQDMQADLARLKHDLDTEVGAFERIKPFQSEIARLQEDLVQANQTYTNSQSTPERAQALGKIQELEKKIKEQSDRISEIERELNVKVTATVNSLMVAEAVRERVQGPVNYSGTDNIVMAASLMAEWTRHVKGQDRNLQAMADIIELDLIGLRDPELKKPRGVFIIAGPTGSGKDFSMEKLNDILTHGATKYDPINGNELQTKEAFSVIAGAEPGYVGHGPGELTMKIRSNPEGVVGITEGDKMHRDIHTGMMQFYETGTFKGKDGTVAVGRNNVVVQTTNLGDEFYNPNKLREIAAGLRSYEDVRTRYGHIQIESSNGKKTLAETLDPAVETQKFQELGAYEYLRQLFFREDGKFSDVARAGIEDSIRKRFPPEVLGRVDAIVIFDPLNRESIGEILDAQFSRFAHYPLLRSNKNAVTISPEVREHLIDKYQEISLSGGARGLRSMVRDRLLHLISTSAKDGLLKPEAELRFEMRDGNIALQIREKGSE